VERRCSPVVGDHDGAAAGRHAGLDLGRAEYVVARHQARAAAASCRRAIGLDSERDNYGGRRPASAPKEPSAPASAALPAGDHERATVEDPNLRRGSLRAGAARAQGPVAGPEAPSRPASVRRAAATATARDLRREPEPPVGSGLAVGATGTARGLPGPAPTAGDEQARRQTIRIAAASPDVGGTATAAAARATEKKERRAAGRFSPGSARGATAETAGARGRRGAVTAGSRKGAVTASPANDDRQHRSRAHGDRGSDMRAPAAGPPEGGAAAGRAVQLERRRCHTGRHGPLVHPRLVEHHGRGGWFGSSGPTQSAERCADAGPDSHRGRRPERHVVECQSATEECQLRGRGSTTCGTPPTRWRRQGRAPAS
jgi:hypothetical protein